MDKMFDRRCFALGSSLGKSYGRLVFHISGQSGQQVGPAMFCVRDLYVLYLSPFLLRKHRVILAIMLSNHALVFPFRIFSRNWLFQGFW